MTCGLKLMQLPQGTSDVKTTILKEDKQQITQFCWNEQRVSSLVQRISSLKDYSFWRFKDFRWPYAKSCRIKSDKANKKRFASSLHPSEVCAFNAGYVMIHTNSYRRSSDISGLSTYHTATPLVSYFIYKLQAGSVRANAQFMRAWGNGGANSLLYSL